MSINHFNLLWGVVGTVFFALSAILIALSGKKISSVSELTPLFTRIAWFGVVAALIFTTVAAANPVNIDAKALLIIQALTLVLTVLIIVASRVSFDEAYAGFFGAGFILTLGTGLAIMAAGYFEGGVMHGVLWPLGVCWVVSCLWMV